MTSIGDEVKKLYGDELQKLPGKKTDRGRFGLIISMIVAAIIAAWILLASGGIYYYNIYATLEQGIQARQAQIEKEFQRRLDLLPNLITVANMYAEHEKSMFKYTSDARSTLESFESMGSELGLKDKAEIKGNIEKAFSKLIALSEQYPDIKATQSFQDLMEKLEDTENRIASARDQYISLVMQFNTQLVTFPSNFFNLLYLNRFKAIQYFESEKRAIPIIGQTDILLKKDK